MGSRATLHATLRCNRCRLLERWCVCDGLQPVTTPLQVAVLMHRRERRRPTSTGHLIGRVVPDARLHEFDPGREPAATTIRTAGRELWILHPQGEDPPPPPPAAGLQVLLLDGNWGESAAMSRAVVGWGRRVALPMTGTSRYWLRAQRADDEFSTAEALIFLLGYLGLQREQTALQTQLELHVYAGLLSRGRKTEAARYLAGSPVGAAFPDLLAKLVPRITA